MSIQKALEFLKENETCVMATVAKDGVPHAATVGYSVDDDFSFLIGTNKNTRKYQNLMKSNKVALVVGFSGSKTVQLEGLAKELDITDNRVEEHLAKLPGAVKFKIQPGQTYFLVKPSWLRFTDYSENQQIFEAKDF